MYSQVERLKFPKIISDHVRPVTRQDFTRVAKREREAKQAEEKRNKAINESNAFFEQLDTQDDVGIGKISQSRSSW